MDVYILSPVFLNISFIKMDSFLFPFRDYLNKVWEYWKGSIEKTMEQCPEFRWKLNWSWQYFLIYKTLESNFIIEMDKDKWIVKYNYKYWYTPIEKTYTRLSEFYIDLYKLCDDFKNRCDMYKRYWENAIPDGRTEPLRDRDPIFGGGTFSDLPF